MPYTVETAAAAGRLGGLARRRVDQRTRFYAKVQQGEGCWLWQGARHQQGGYGLFNFDGKLQVASRVMWQLERGPIPDGLHVLHTCDNPPCVNPAHLFVGSAAENAQDRGRKGRHGAHRYPERFTCEAARAARQSRHM